MDCREEQKSEIEALEAIFPDELNILSTKPFHSFTISIQSSDDEDCEDTMSIVLKFTYVEDYPKESPWMEVESSQNFTEIDETALINLLLDEAKSQLGEVMVFQLVSSSIEWLKQRADDKRDQLIRDEETKKIKEEEEERCRFEGTCVTVESFLAWKVKFDQEREELKRKEQSRLEYGTGRLTGRELFEKDKSLNESELRFLEDGETEVQVDESLFQELDGLDLEDDPEVE